MLNLSVAEWENLRNGQRIKCPESIRIFKKEHPDKKAESLFFIFRHNFLLYQVKYF